MSDEIKKVTDEAGAIANPASDATELGEEALKDVTGGEAVSFNFSKIEYTYKTQSPDGSDK